MPTKFKLLAGLNTAFLLFLSFSLFAQTSITGRVLNSSDKQPVVGATVQAKGGKSATTTGSDGSFTITSTQKVSALVITIVGYESITVPVNGNSIGEVYLTTSTTSLNDVVVTGYTTQKKKDLTGAIDVVNVKDMKAIQAGSPEQMLQGQASGVTVITSGAPGGPTNVFIRGVTSFGNTDPLYIIDGVPLPYHDINSNDIESVQILKDASASVFGVRGSNGVVIITTKRGRSTGKPTLTYDGYYGTQIPLQGNPFHLLNAQELANALWKADITSGQVGANGFPSSQQYGNAATPVLPDYITPGGAKAGSAAVNPALYNTDYSKGPIYQITAANKQGTNWFSELFKQAPIQSHNVGLSGGSDKSTYFFSLGYFNQQGTLINTYLKRYMARMNATFNLAKGIRVGENFYAFYLNNPQINYFGENQINYDYREQPIIPVHDIMGNWGGSNGPELGNSPNPVANQTRTANNRGNSWYIMGNAWGEVDFLKHFTIRTSIGGLVNNNYSWAFTYHTYENAENNGSNGFQENASYTSYWDWLNTLTYSNTFGKSNLKVFVGSEAIDQYNRGIQGNRINYFSDNQNLWTLTNGDPKGQTNASGVGEGALYSLFAQGIYSYNDRYLLTATIRRDGASVFGQNSQYGYFPAFSAGWVFTQEDFLQSATWINFGKIRASWGKLGSYANVNPINQYTLYSAGAGQSYYDIAGTSSSTVLGFHSSHYGSQSTSWEEDVITDIGLDAVFLKNKLEFSIDFYQKKINGLLFQDIASATSGAFSSIQPAGAQLPAVNIGDVQNNGVDISLTYHATLSPVSKLNLTGIFTTYNSKVISIPGAGGYFTTGGSRIGDLVRNQAGHPVGSFYGYKVIGYFSDASDVTKSPKQQDAAPGRFKYADVNGDGKIDASDRTFIGNPNPSFTYGLNITATVKNFDFTALFYGSSGNQVLDYQRYWTDMWASFQGNKSINLLYNSWTPSNLNPKAPILENASTFSTNTVPNSFYIEDGSFFKMRSFIIGYTIPESPLKSVGIDRLRVYVQGSNLFTITGYQGLDPEIGGNSSAFGIDYGSYPGNQKSYSVGLSLTF